MAAAKLTISVKRRLSNGDEVFIAPGIEMHCPSDELEEKQSEVTERVNNWMDQLLEAYPDSDPMDEDEDEAEDEAEDEDADEDEGDEEWPSESEIRKMKKADLKALAEEAEVELEGTTVKDIREELIEIFHGDEEDEDADEEDEDEENEAEDEDEEDDELYTEEELEDFKLEELQEIIDTWELDHPRFKKGAPVKAKKAKYIELILATQEEAEDE